jgi:hypothetical protein
MAVDSGVNLKAQIAFCPMKHMTPKCGKNLLNS